MKQISFLFCVFTFPAVAATPSTSCPSGFVAFEDANVIIATSCPAGYTGFDIESCLVSSPSSGCYMYAPAGVSYTDDTGTYEFTDACPMS